MLTRNEPNLPVFVIKWTRHLDLFDIQIWKSRFYVATGVNICEKNFLKKILTTKGTQKLMMMIYTQRYVSKQNTYFMLNCIHFCSLYGSIALTTTLCVVIW